MKSLRILFSFILLSTILLVSCQEDTSTVINDVPISDEDIIAKYLALDLNSPDNYSVITYPPYYTPSLQNDNTPVENQVTDIGATLGRVLFYDVNLSVNGTISCASCHKQNLGFTDDLQFSLGFEGVETGAHSMRLGNTHLYGGEAMFWDKRAPDLEFQTTQPIQDGIEMGFDASHGGFTALISKLNTLEYYPILFENAFGDDLITEERVQNAMAQFIRSMASVNSKFDEGYSQVFNQQNGPGPGNNNLAMDFPNFTNEENIGKRLFVLAPQNGGAGCQGCHQAPSFSLIANSRSNGLDAGETIVFKSASLKNVGVSGPFMHDGRFQTLIEVVEHYDNGIQGGPALDNRLRPFVNGPGLNLSEVEKSALVAFLNTLNDNVLNTDPKFSDPFK